MNNAELCKRAEQLKAQRTNIQEMWDAIERYVTPYRGRFFKDNSTEHSIEWDKRWVYDSTAVMAHQTLAASLHGALTSPAIRWFEIRFRQEELNKNKAARTWLEDASEQVYYELQDSNFNLEVNEAYQDITGFGTAMMILDESTGSRPWNGFDFEAIPLKECYFEDGFDGNLLRVYREVKWTPAQIIAKFGDKVPQSVKDKEDAGSQERLEVLFVIQPRHGRLTPLHKKLPPSRTAWEYRYILKAGCEDLGKPGGYHEMPAFAPRWRKTSESMWGNSPAMIAMGDILSLNHARKLQLVAAEKMIDPPIFAEERAIIGDLNLSSAELTIVRDKDGIMPYLTQGNIPVSDLMIEQLQGAVKDYFFTEQLQMPSPQAQPMTATEIQLRYEQMQRLLGPTLGRLANDLLDPLISRAFRMLSRAGQIPEPPEVVIDVDPEFDIEYMGSLARAQKQDGVASIERWVMTGAQLAEVMPDVLDVPDPHEIMRGLGRKLNVPAPMMRDEQEVQDIAEQRQDDAAQMQAAMKNEQAGNAAKAMGEGTQAMVGAEQVAQDFEGDMNGAGQAPPASAGI